MARVRRAELSDAEAIAEVLGVLGYPATAKQVRERMRRMRRQKWMVILVGDVEGRAAGLATGHVWPSIHSTTPVAYLTTLSVSESHQRRGIGALLTRAIEKWARARGAVRVSLTSGLQRAGAHAFYEHLGFERTGVRLTRPLVEGAPAYPVSPTAGKPQR